MITLRDYQQEIGIKASTLLLTDKIAYLSMEVRTGKTLTGLHAANLYIHALNINIGVDLAPEQLKHFAKVLCVKIGRAHV